MKSLAAALRVFVAALLPAVRWQGAAWGQGRTGQKKTAAVEAERQQTHGWRRGGAGGEGEVWPACFITWTLVGRARDGAALGWTDASPKRNHRISSTQEEKTRDKGEEKERTSKWEGRGGERRGGRGLCAVGGIRETRQSPTQHDSSGEKKT